MTKSKKTFVFIGKVCWKSPELVAQCIHQWRFPADLHQTSLPSTTI